MFNVTAAPDSLTVDSVRGVPMTVMIGAEAMRALLEQVEHNFSYPQDDSVATFCESVASVGVEPGQVVVSLADEGLLLLMTILNGESNRLFLDFAAQRDLILELREAVGK